ncbi:MAG: hypothetical protein ACRDPJ_18465, partial [Nocardioidaceae bacterium]
GRNNGAAQMAGSSSMALAFAGGGTLVALAAPDPGAEAFAAILVGGAAAALLGLLISGRVVPRTEAARFASAVDGPAAAYRLRTGDNPDLQAGGRESSEPAAATSSG